MLGTQLNWSPLTLTKKQLEQHVSKLYDNEHRTGVRIMIFSANVKT